MKTCGNCKYSKKLNSAKMVLCIFGCLDGDIPEEVPANEKGCKLWELKEGISVTKNQCDGCEKWDNKKDVCKVFKKMPEKCWAYTTDPDWAKKVREATEHYRSGRDK